MPFVDISPIELPSSSILLTASEIERLGLEPGSQVQIRAGSASAEAEVTTSLKGNYISLEVLHTLGLPRVPSLTLRKGKAKTLHLGPLIGIIISRGKKYKAPPYSSQTRILRSFLNYSSSTGCIAYVFSPAGVDAAHKSISGHFLLTGPDGVSHWQKHTFPLPDVIYDRILYRTYENRKLTKLVTSYLANQRNIDYFNPKFLNKWETFSILSKNPVFKPHLPETKPYDRPEKLVKFLEDHETVYLKPINGSLGKGIIRVCAGHEGYTYQYRDGRKTVTGTVSSGEELAATLKTFMNSTRYIMQKGLDLLKYQGRVFDIRVLMQKNGQGQWIDSAMVARVAMAGSIFPNIAAGGEAVNLSNLWHQLTDQVWETSETCSVIRNISLAAGVTLEKALGTFGEIGLDIGVDSLGNAWIIEINSKPSRKVFPKDEMHLRELSIRLPIDYSRYLAGFAGGKETDLP